MKKYFFVAILIVFIVLGIGLAVRTTKMESKHKELDLLFKKLEQSPVSKERRYYSSSHLWEPVEKEEFECLVCGAKTVYDLSPYEGDRKAEIDRYSSVVYVNIYKSRLKVISEMGKKYGMSFVLDASDFCPQCNKGKLKRECYLEVKYKNGDMVRSVLVESEDLNKLSSFLKGRTTWAIERERDKSLQKEIPLLKYLLGWESDFIRPVSKQLSPGEKVLRSSFDIGDILEDDILGEDIPGETYEKRMRRLQKKLKSSSST